LVQSPIQFKCRHKHRKIIFQINRKTFPTTPHHRFHKIFNKNTIKLSYSCMPNVKNTIANHNHKILNSNTQKDRSNATCNCNNKTNCPLNGKCLTKSVVYRATISTQQTKSHYIGCCETPFKTRYSNHLQSFKNQKYRNATALSKEFWKLKETGANPTISWNIIKRAHSYRSGSKRCNLCLEEKVAILQADPQNLLNKRTELVARCRHRSKFKLRRSTN